MFELRKPTENTWYIESPAKIGIVRLSESEAVLIDTGNDKDAGRKIKKILDQEGLTPVMILNTHSNADHIGGNQYLQNQFHCPIYAPGIEAAFTRDPVLEPSFLYGAYPPKELRHKFLMARPSEVSLLTEKILPEGFKIIDLPGHFFEMKGFIAPDGTAFIADCLSSQETLEKYKIGFIYDVGAYLDTLEAIKKIDAPLFIPSHAAPTQDIIKLADLNVRAVEEICEAIVKILATPKSAEEVLKEIFDRFELQMTFEQYALIGSTVRSYLSYLKESGKVKADIQENRLLWSAL